MLISNWPLCGGKLRPMLNGPLPRSVSRTEVTSKLSVGV